jgi:UDP-glucose 4-epimerase
LVPSALPEARTFCLRLGYLYGPDEAARPTRQRVSLMQEWIDRAGRGEALDVADPAPRRDWTFVPDLAPAIDRLLAGPGDPVPRHLCAPVAVSDAEVAALLVREYPGVTLRRVPSPPMKAPMKPSRLAALEGFAWTDVATGLSRIVRAVA